MAYTPINWQTGDTITAEKMNKMDNGWGVSSTQLFSESVTTATVEGEFAPLAMLTYSTQITAPTLSVTVNNVTYEVPMTTIESGNVYGELGATGPSFANYPFFLWSTPNGNGFYTEVAGTYSVSASAPTIEVSSNFASAVTTSFDVSALPLRCVSGVTHAQEMSTAQRQGRMLYFYTSAGLCLFIYDMMSYPPVFTPSVQGVSVGFDQSGYFVVTES